MCKCSPLVQSPISKAFQSFVRLELKTVYTQTPDATSSTHSPQTALSLLTFLHTPSPCKRKAVIFLNTTT